MVVRKWAACALALAALLLLAACGRAMPFEVHIASPQDGAVASSAQLSVAGLVSPAVRQLSYTLNDGAAEALDVTDGGFGFEVDLRPGVNVIRVTARSRDQTAADSVTVTYEPPIGELPALLGDDDLDSAPLYRESSLLSARTQPRVLVSPPNGPSLRPQSAPDLRPDQGQMVYVQEQDGARRIVLINAATLRRTLLYAGARHLESAAVSLDGSLVAFTAERRGNLEVFLYDLGGGILGAGRLVRLTDTPADERRLSMSLRVGSGGSLTNQLVLVWETDMVLRSLALTSYVIAKLDTARQSISFEPVLFEGQDWDLTYPSLSGNGGAVISVIPPGIFAEVGGLLSCPTTTETCSIFYQGASDEGLRDPSFNYDGTAAVFAETFAAAGGEFLVYAHPASNRYVLLGQNLGYERPMLSADGAHLAFTQGQGVFARPLGDLGEDYSFPPGLERISGDDGYASYALYWARFGGSAKPDTVLGPPDESRFNITLRFFDDSLTPQQHALFERAARRWEEVVTADLESVPVNLGAADTTEGAPGLQGVVDDMVIDVSAPFVDGPGNVLARAGPYIVRADGSARGLTLYGIIEFDSGDLLPGGSLEDEEQLFETVLHELGHVLGIGSLWSRFGVVTGTGGVPGDPAYDPRYQGSQAVAEWRALGGTGDVPVENTGGPGTADGHWRELTFKHELMTGYADPGPEPLSRMTAASLADLGYTVALAATDAYVLPPPPVFEQLAPTPRMYDPETEFAVASGSALGEVEGLVQVVDVNLGGDRANTSGCEAADFGGFVSGRVALIQRGGCTFADKVANAVAAGATGVILFNQGDSGARSGVLSGITLGDEAPVPVIGISFGLGAALAATSGLRVRINSGVQAAGSLRVESLRPDFRLVEEVLTPRYQLDRQGRLTPLD